MQMIDKYKTHTKIKVVNKSIRPNGKRKHILTVRSSSVTVKRFVFVFAEIFLRPLQMCVFCVVALGIVCELEVYKLQTKGNCMEMVNLLNINHIHILGESNRPITNKFCKQTHIFGNRVKHLHLFVLIKKKMVSMLKDM